MPEHNGLLRHPVRFRVTNGDRAVALLGINEQDRLERLIQTVYFQDPLSDLDKNALFDLLHTPKSTHLKVANIRDIEPLIKLSLNFSQKLSTKRESLLSVEIYRFASKDPSDRETILLFPEDYLENLRLTIDVRIADFESDLRDLRIEELRRRYQAASAELGSSNGSPLKIQSTNLRKIGILIDFLDSQSTFPLREGFELVKDLVGQNNDAACQRLEAMLSTVSYLGKMYLMLDFHESQANLASAKVDRNSLKQSLSAIIKLNNLGSLTSLRELFKDHYLQALQLDDAAKTKYILDQGLADEEIRASDLEAWELARGSDQEIKDSLKEFLDPNGKLTETLLGLAEIATLDSRSGSSQIDRRDLLDRLEEAKKACPLLETFLNDRLPTYSLLVVKDQDQSELLNRLTGDTRLEHEIASFALKYWEEERISDDDYWKMFINRVREKVDWMETILTELGNHFGYEEGHDAKLNRIGLKQRVSDDYGGPLYRCVFLSINKLPLEKRHDEEISERSIIHRLTSSPALPRLRLLAAQSLARKLLLNDDQIRETLNLALENFNSLLKFAKETDSIDRPTLSQALVKASEVFPALKSFMANKLPPQFLQAQDYDPNRISEIMG